MTRKMTPSPRQAEYLAHVKRFQKRHKRNPMQKELAEIMGVSAQTIARYQRRIEVKQATDMAAETPEARTVVNPHQDLRDDLTDELCPTLLAFLVAIHRGIREQGYAPTIQEYAASQGWAALSYIQQMRDTLVRRGYLEIEPNKSRAVRLTAKCFAPSPSRKGA